MKYKSCKSLQEATDTVKELQAEGYVSYWLELRKGVFEVRYWK